MPREPGNKRYGETITASPYLLLNYPLALASPAGISAGSRLDDSLKADFRAPVLAN
jgi:hypothetical protein